MVVVVTRENPRHLAISRATQNNHPAATLALLS